MSFMQSAEGKVLLCVALAQVYLMSWALLAPVVQQRSKATWEDAKKEQSVDMRVKMVNVTAEKVIGNVLYDGVA